MGIGVSSWQLARAVSLTGQLGVVSGTALDTVFVRRLQNGDIGGHIRRAMGAFPFPSIVEDVIRRFYRDGGRPATQSYKRLPLHTVKGTPLLRGVTMLANFVEVFLAKEGHDGKVGINLLTKVQLPTLASLYGAMLAGVDYVLMGAGIPREIPGVLDRLKDHLPVQLKVDVANASPGDPPLHTHFDPTEFHASPLTPLQRPSFLPIVSSHSLATVLSKKSTGSIEGFVVEGPTAGGHNAPPRGTPTFDSQGQPVYGTRDEVDYEALRALNLPFWIAGGVGSPEGLRDAQSHGAVGIQVGTLFAFCAESGLAPPYKQAVITDVVDGKTAVFTDPVASPTGYPFKIASVAGTLSDNTVYSARQRVCDNGYLREAYRQDSGRIDYRCAAEPVDTYIRKGGKLEATEGRKCLCNALLADVGLGQIQKHGETELPLVTSGDDIGRIRHLVADSGETYSASSVVEYLLDTPSS